MAPDFSIHPETLDEERVVLVVSGDVDLFTAPQLKSALNDALESGHIRIVVDLTPASFLDSTALGVLMGAVKRVRGRGGALTIANTDPTIDQTFEVTGLRRVLTICPTREQALKALEAGDADGDAAVAGT